MTTEVRAAVRGWTDAHFVGLLAADGTLGAAIRLRYVLTDRRPLIGGDGFDYHLSALRLADGLGYTSVFGSAGQQSAHHPPGWVTVLGVVSWLGARSQRDHQLVGAIIGLGVVILAGLIGRRYFNPRVGIIAALLAALYPGFWVLEGNILSEPLALLVLGFLTLAIGGLRERPTLRRSVIAGALCGVLALVRSEQVFLLPIVVAPLLMRARPLSGRQRATFIAVAVLACGAVVAPWTIYNSTRFKDPVLLSTNDGALLLTGNCPPLTYSGKYIGYYDSTCNFRVAIEHPTFDASQTDVAARKIGLSNIRHNVGKLPIVIPVRFGRVTALFRPSQTVGFVAHWMTTSRRPVWAWVVSYWLLLPFAILGAVVARRSRAYVLPLVGPLFVVAATVAVSYGEPRYHTPSDLGVIVLAAVGIDRIAVRSHRRPPAATEPLVEGEARLPTTVS